MSDELWRTIADDLSIPKFQNEKNDSFMLRLIYSAMGRWMLAAVWDFDGEYVSIQHIKSKGEEFWRALFDIYKIQIQLCDLTQWVNYCYEIYLQSGFFYHKSNRISPAVFSTEISTEIEFLRGLTPNEKCQMSGLGTYKSADIVGAQYPSNMFNLQEMEISHWWDEFVVDRQWQIYNPYDKTEYLNLRRRAYDYYWQDKLKPHSGVSLLRSGEKGTQIYYLYRMEGDNILCSPLPDFQVQNGEYLRVATAIWKQHEVLPAIKARHYLDGAQTIAYSQITLNSLLPPSENTWFELYTWPTDWCEPSSFKPRLMAYDIFPVFKSLAQRLGYTVEEELL